MDRRTSLTRRRVRNEENAGVSERSTRPPEKSLQPALRFVTSYDRCVLMMVRVLYSIISFQITDLHSLHRDLVPYVSWIKTLDLPPSNPKSIFGGIRGSSTSNAGKAGMRIEKVPFYVP